MKHGHHWKYLCQNRSVIAHVYANMFTLWGVWVFVIDNNINKITSISWCVKCLEKQRRWPRRFATHHWYALMLRNKGSTAYEHMDSICGVTASNQRWYLIKDYRNYPGHGTSSTPCSCCTIEQYNFFKSLQYWFNWLECWIPPLAWVWMEHTVPFSQWLLRRQLNATAILYTYLECIASAMDP